MASSVPDKFSAGTTFALTLAYTAYPAPDWKAQLILRGPQMVTLHAAAEGAQHLIRVSAAATSLWLAGRYQWAIRFSREDDTFEAETGQIVVGGDIATPGAPADQRTHARKVLDAVEAVLENRATTDQQKYTINNRELWRTPIADLLLLRSRYRDEVRREEQSLRCGQSLLGRQVKVRF